jgi:hypothetical protein
VPRSRPRPRGELHDLFAHHAAHARAQGGRRQVPRRDYARRINDLAADGHGGAYYTQGGLFHAKADGTVDTIAAAGNPQQGGLFTNGLVLSPDGKTLYVTNRLTMLAFDVGADGGLSNRRDFATLQGEPQGSFGGDGLTVDADGRLYVTGGAGIYVFDKAGKQLGIIPTPRRAITAAFAGPDRKTLYAGTLGAVTPDGENWANPARRPQHRGNDLPGEHAGGGGEEVGPAYFDSARATLTNSATLNVSARRCGSMPSPVERGERAGQPLEALSQHLAPLAEKHVR